MAAAGSLWPPIAVRRPWFVQFGVLCAALICEPPPSVPPLLCATSLCAALICAPPPWARVSSALISALCGDFCRYVKYIGFRKYRIMLLFKLPSFELCLGDTADSNNSLETVQTFHLCYSFSANKNWYQANKEGEVIIEVDNCIFHRGSIDKKGPSSTLILWMAFNFLLMLIFNFLLMLILHCYD